MVRWRVRFVSLLLGSIGALVAPAANAWWNDGWAFRKELTLDASSLDEAVRHAIAVGKEISSERSWFNSRRRGFVDKGTLGTRR